ncbi:ATP-binding cassette domain-containing protein, partial [Streptomyces alboverticillatus]
MPPTELSSRGKSYARRTRHDKASSVNSRHHPDGGRVSPPRTDRRTPASRARHTPVTCGNGRATRPAETVVHHAVERLPQGYDTVVGEQGLTLSGGQRQCIALARALVGDPAILVLDDATSAIDARVEAEIHAGLHAETRRRTTLIVAHRRSTLELADRIAVLDGGRVTDTGTLDELRARSALFRTLLST